MDTVKNEIPEFVNPTAADMPQGKVERYPLVKYAAMKRPQASVARLTKEEIQEEMDAGRAGFSFWEKSEIEGEPGRVVSLGAKPSLVVLEAYCGLSGYVPDANGKNGVNYFSTLVKNSGQEPFTLFMSGVARPVAIGYYRGKKSENDKPMLCRLPATVENIAENLQDGNHKKLPDGVSFHQHLVVWWIEGQRLLEVKLTTMVSRELKNAVSNAYLRAGKKIRPESVNTFTLFDSSLWRFNENGFKKCARDGSEYAGRGEMFLMPVFECGVLPENTGDEQGDFCRTMREKQAEIRAAYDAEKERRAKYRNADGSVNDASQPDSDAAYQWQEPTQQPTSPVSATDLTRPAADLADDLPF